MMPWFVLLLTVAAQAAPTVLISGFDPFHGRPVNNSWSIAREVQTQLAAAGVEAQTCLLPTSYERSMPAMEACLNALAATPDLVLSLGEVGCALKLETRALNVDNNPRPGSLPDNDGVHRARRTIVPGASPGLGFRLSMPDMYCALSESERRASLVSTSAGSFVCNHLAMRFSWEHPELVYGFIHVPEYRCRQGSDNPALAASIVKMALRQLEVAREAPPGRLASTRAEFEQDWENIPDNRQCARDFLNLWKRGLR